LFDSLPAVAMYNSAILHETERLSNSVPPGTTPGKTWQNPNNVESNPQAPADGK